MYCIRGMQGLLRSYSYSHLCVDGLHLQLTVTISLLLWLSISLNVKEAIPIDWCHPATRQHLVVFIHGPLKWGGAMAWTLGGWSSPERRGRWSQYSGRVEVGKMATHFPRWLRWKRCLILWAEFILHYSQWFLRCQKRSFSDSRLYRCRIIRLFQKPTFRSCMKILMTMNLVNSGKVQIQD